MFAHTNRRKMLNFWRIPHATSLSSANGLGKPFKTFFFWWLDRIYIQPGTKSKCLLNIVHSFRNFYILIRQPNMLIWQQLYNVMVNVCYSKIRFLLLPVKKALTDTLKPAINWYKGPNAAKTKIFGMWITLSLDSVSNAWWILNIVVLEYKSITRQTAFSDNDYRTRALGVTLAVNSWSILKNWKSQWYGGLIGFCRLTDDAVRKAFVTILLNAFTIGK